MESKEVTMSFTDELVELIRMGNKTVTRRPMEADIAELVKFVGSSDEENTNLEFLGLMYGEWMDEGVAQPMEYLAYCTEYPEEGVVPIGQGRGNVGDVININGVDDLQLKITSVQIEFLHSITTKSAIKEGFSAMGDTPPKAAFMKLWDGIYQNWKDNPLVWVIEFEVNPQ